MARREGVIKRLEGCLQERSSDLECCMHQSIDEAQKQISVHLDHSKEFFEGIANDIDELLHQLKSESSHFGKIPNCS